VTARNEQAVLAVDKLPARAGSQRQHLQSGTRTADPLPIEHRALLRFMIFYGALFSAFGLLSPFLPAFLAGRGLDSEQVGFVLGLATAVRLVCGPIAGRFADALQAFRAELAVCAILAASAALLYLLVHGFWAVLAISLLQAAVLAPSFPSRMPFHSPMLDQNKIGQDLNMAGCAVLGRPRSLSARCWPGTR
jgi:predicted MFS family arabinose efflux permease